VTDPSRNASPPEAGEVPEAAGALARAAVASAVARQAGGAALVLLAPPETGAELRCVAQAGFPDGAAVARLLAAIRPAVEAVHATGGSRDLEPCEESGPDAALVASCLQHEGRRHGVLVTVSPAVPDEAGRRSLERLVARLAERVDHVALEAELDRLRRRLRDNESQAEKKGEEILRLSEALFAQDIEILRSQEKLGQVEELKNDFIEKMSRELRTPLNGIIESIISVLANENDALSEGAKSVLRSALDDGTAFLRTLQNILDLWRIKQGELPLELHEVSFREVVDEALFSIQDTLGQKPIRIEKRLAEPFPKVRTDLAKINQILFLLLDNAAKFTEQGTISIEAAVEGQDLVCSVADTGIGICADDQQFIFDAFFQVDATGSTRFRGSGLGLALVRDLVTLMGGSMQVSSEPGRGSRFGFRLPVQPLG